MPKRWDWKIFSIGVAAGLLLLLGWRWVTYQDETTHYHANFGVYINGVREEFKDSGYYQEVVSCQADHADDPMQRAHLHDSISDVVHVHDKAVTWGQLFENLGWSLSGLALKTPGRVYVENHAGRLSYILNGQAIEDVASRRINSHDKLLVSYGTGDPAKQYQLVGTTAEQFNQQDDPAACAGVENGWKTRLRHLLF